MYTARRVNTARRWPFVWLVETAQLQLCLRLLGETGPPRVVSKALYSSRM